MDSKQNQGQQDRLRVDLNDPSEVGYLQSQYPEKSHQQIKDAIKKYDPMRADIVNNLDNG